MLTGLDAWLIDGTARVDVGNYQVGSMFDEPLRLLMSLPLAFIAGAWLAPAAMWAFAPNAAGERAQGPSPLSVTAGVVLGALAGTALQMLGRLATMGGGRPGGQATDSPELLVVLNFLLYLAAIAGGAWVGWGVARPRPASRAARAGTALAVPSLLLGTAWWLAVPRHDFPGMQAPAAARDAWAHKTFEWRYGELVERLRACPRVQAAVGRVTSIAPVTGPNRTMMTPGETAGTFTLELVGDRERGYARVDFMTHRHGEKPGRTWAIDGKLYVGGASTADDSQIVFYADATTLIHDGKEVAFSCP